MSRAEWENLIQRQDFPVEINISSTPMAAIARNAEKVGCFAETSIDGDNIITTFRNDL